MKCKKLLVLLATLLLTTGAALPVFSNINSVKADAAVQHEVPLVQNSKLGQGFYSPNQKLELPNPILRTDPSTFFNSIKQGAVDTWKKHNFLPSVTAAQAAIESGWGTSGLTAAANNLFGIKGRYNGQYVVFPTQEWVNGHYVTINAEFRKYPNWATSVEDHGNFFTDNERYHNLLGVKDYKQVAKLVQQDGYATDPNYAATIIRVIEQYGLQNWDQEAFNGTTETVKVQKNINLNGTFHSNTNANLFYLVNGKFEKATDLSGSAQYQGKSGHFAQMVQSSANNTYLLYTVNNGGKFWINANEVSLYDHVLKTNTFSAKAVTKAGTPKLGLWPNTELKTLGWSNNSTGTIQQQKVFQSGQTLDLIDGQYWIDDQFVTKQHIDSDNLAYQTDYKTAARFKENTNTTMYYLSGNNFVYAWDQGNSKQYQNKVGNFTKLARGDSGNTYLMYVENGVGKFWINSNELRLQDKVTKTNMITKHVNIKSGYLKMTLWPNSELEIAGWSDNTSGNIQQQKIFQSGRVLDLIDGQYWVDDAAITK
ncbi:glycoside hydrolase family 73 protein [Latilactobacillus sakei]